jgi:predicted ester cyclase
MPLDGLDSVAPTGKAFALREFVFWRVSDGKIVERDIVVDTWGMLHQLGVLPLHRATNT